MFAQKKPASRAAHYVSDRVYDGVRKTPADKAARRRAQLKRMLDRKSKEDRSENDVCVENHAV